MSTEQEIKEHVLKMTKSKMLKGFYASIIQKQTKAEPQLVQKVLINLVDEGALVKQYELICPNDHCLRVLDETSSLEDFKKEYECEYCGEEIDEIEPSFIQLRFLINRK